MPTVTAMANDRMKYAAGVTPRVSNPGVTIDLATNAAIGCVAQVLTRPRPSNPRATGTPATAVLVAHHRTGPTDWVSARMCVPCSYSRANSGPPANAPSNG